jgi:hypothetical protein
MQLDARETSLSETFRRLPPGATAELTALAERLAALSANSKIDWSGSWSDEDLSSSQLRRSAPASGVIASETYLLRIGTGSQ